MGMNTASLLKFITNHPVSTINCRAKNVFNEMFNAFDEVFSHQHSIFVNSTTSQNVVLLPGYVELLLSLWYIRFLFYKCLIEIVDTFWKALMESMPLQEKGKPHFK